MSSAVSGKSDGPVLPVLDWHHHDEKTVILSFPEQGFGFREFWGDFEVFEGFRTLVVGFNALVSFGPKP